MRILLWSESFWPRIGGVEVAGVNLCRSLLARGHEVVVLTARDHVDAPERELLDGTIPVLRRRFREPQEAGDVAAIAAEREWVAALRRELRPDVVHIFHIGANVLFHVLTLDAAPAPVVVSFHLIPGPELLGPRTAMGRTVREAAWVTACSQAVCRDLLARAPELADRTSAIPNRVPAPGREPVDPPWPPRFLLLGRLVEQKGFDVGLRAFAAVAARHPDVRLTLAGDGKRRAHLARLVAELELEDRVEMPGWVAPEAVPALMESCSVVVMPSRFDPHPLVALQAAQAGRPVIASAVDGLPETVRPDRTGILVPPDDVDALAEAWEALASDRRRVEELGRQARRHAETALDWEGHVNAFEEVYLRVAGRPGAGATSAG